MHIWGRAHRVRRRGGLGVTSREETGQQPPRGLRGSSSGCMLMRRGATAGASAGVNAVCDG